MSALGQKQTLRPEIAMSALCQKQSLAKLSLLGLCRVIRSHHLRDELLTSQPHHVRQPWLEKGREVGETIPLCRR